MSLNVLCYSLLESHIFKIVVILKIFFSYLKEVFKILFLCVYVGVRMRERVVMSLS